MGHLKALLRTVDVVGVAGTENTQVRVQRTYERGSGETLACGTGAAVAARAALQTGRVPGPSVPVRLRGGELIIHRRGTSLAMEGPARTVFLGEAEIPGR